MTADNKHYWLKAGSFNLILNVQNLVFGFGGFYFLVRMLSKHEFGIWSLFVATTTILETARSGLIQNALIKFLSSAPEKDHPDILSASFLISGVLMVICLILNISVAGFLAHLWHYEGLTSMFYLYCVVYLVASILLQFQWIEQAYLGFKGVLITTIIRQAGFFLYVLVCFAFGIKTSLVNLIYAQGASAMAAAIVQYLFVRHHLNFPFRIHMEWVKKLFGFGKYAFGTNFSAMLTGTVNQMLIGTFLSPDAAGSFNVALRITNLADIPANAISTIVFPQSARRFEKHGSDAAKYLYEKSVGVILAMLVPALVALYISAYFVVDIIAGRTYEDTVPLIQVTIITCLLNPFHRMSGIILDSVGKPNVNFAVTSLFMLTSMTMTYILLRSYGIMGAAYAILVTDIVFFVIIQSILRKYFSVNFLSAFIYGVRIYPELYQTYVRSPLKPENHS
jgi:O-antigen/teichoic acid export membrane protein